ncbi:hypothetical protein ACFY9F_36610 [Streptomyces sp. NPDC012421]|uniref:hypothetical protein n=1 Tax=Streptomyces sp. NPDC012421 TaxID=3364832 RepID=UPI0036E506C0
MSNTLRTSVGALAVGAVALTVATVRRDDADWLAPALWVAWPVWAVLAAVTARLIRRQA